MTQKASLIQRVRAVRTELYGEQGVEALAETLRIPAKTLRNYERGLTMPAALMLEFLDVTAADPHWLLTGEGKWLSSRRGPCLTPNDRLP